MPIEINGVPAPSGTCAISLATDGKVVLHMPGQRAEQHTIKLTPDANGMRALVHILTRREREPHATIRADMTAPTQIIVDEWLAANRPAPAQSIKPTIPETVRLDSIDVDDLLEGLEIK